jgi:6-phosphogluconolactonase
MPTRVLHFAWLFCLVVLAGCGAAPGASSAAPPVTAPVTPATPVASTHQVFTQTNDATANAVLVLSPAGDGSLSETAAIPTGGKGSGGGLENQGSLALNEDSSLLFVVNAGSNDFSVFRVSSTTLTLASRTPSGGLVPISVSEAKGIVYVLNAGSRAGAADNISGFEVGTDGTVTPIANATRALSAASTSAAQVSLNQDATIALVTERGTATLDMFSIDANGLAGPTVSAPSSGTIPFGFQFLDPTHVFISEEGTNGVSSYQLNAGQITPLTKSARNFQTGTCWLAIAPSGKFLFTTNTIARTLSAYSIAADGTTALVGSSGVAATASGPPIDAIVSPDGKFLYLVDSGEGVDTFTIAANGALTLLKNLTGINTTLNGIVAY